VASVIQATDWSIATQIEQFSADMESIVDRSTGICRIFTKATGAPLEVELAKRKAEEGSHASNGRTSGAPSSSVWRTIAVTPQRRYPMTPPSRPILQWMT
jgi:hypothetical protein